jgi:hypothetical protein
MKRIVPLVILLSAFTAAGFDQPKIAFAPRHYLCCRATGPLYIDGNLSEVDWQRVAWTEPFIDIEGVLKPPPRFATRAKMLWDDEYFYVAAEIEEPDVWATLREHDSIIFNDNDFELFIDPDGDTHRYYELELNALTTAWDLYLDRPYRDTGNPTFFWDIRGLQKGVVVQGSINQPGDTDRGWTIELALPWSVLKEQAPEGRAPQPGEYWRVNFSRVEWQVQREAGGYVKVKNATTGRPLPEDNWVWSPQGLINMHFPEMWGFVLFSGRPAGEGSELFSLPEAESIKWLLRLVYYQQRNRYEQDGRYARNWSELNLHPDRPAGYQWPPRIYTGPETWEAVLTTADGHSSWHIRQDGLVWRTPKR